MTANYERTLVTRALELVGESSNVYAAEVLGVSEGTIRRWRAGDISTPLRTGTRVGLIRYIEEREGGQTAPPPEDEWSRFSLGMVRHAGGSRPMTEDERTLVQYDVLEGLIRLGIEAGKEVGALQNLLRQMEAAGLPERQPRGSLGAGPPPSRGRSRS